MKNEINTEFLVPDSIIVNVGDIPLGGKYPLRIQSMTNTNTMDTKGTVEQCMALFDAGCDYVRITSPGVKEAENLSVIKKKLVKKGYNKPLIADIHFQPLAAETAARFVEKIRINPGNYTDRKLKVADNISESEYYRQIEIMRKKVSSLTDICKQYGTVIRIGVNHGSLSERIVNRYGNTPEGMVQSALEFISVCESLNFSNIVISMKSSSISTMAASARLLIYNMIKSSKIYPLHLGVTEAGADEDGIAKSAAGCATLLKHGIGDTIRVSLTGDPVAEVPVAYKIADFFKTVRVAKPDRITESEHYKFLIEPSEKRESARFLNNISGTKFPVIFSSFYNPAEKELSMSDLGFELDNKTKKWLRPSDAPDIIHANKIYLPSEPEFDKNKFITNAFLENEGHNFLNFSNSENAGDKNFSNSSAILMKVETDKPAILSEVNDGTYKNWNGAVLAELNVPVINKNTLLNISMTLGPLLVDGKIDGILYHRCNFKGHNIKLANCIFTVLQSTGKRINGPEYISCPTCGRTTYDLSGTLNKIKNRTRHLKNIKIAVMGCIVNGPGEMADADYGYVGASKGQVNIYKNKKIVYKNINETEAIDLLVALINKDLTE